MMADELSVSFGPVLAGAYHIAIESTFKGKCELIKAQSEIALEKAPIGGISEQALTTFGAPFGALIGKLMGVTPSDDNFKLPSVPIFTETNLFAAQQIIDYSQINCRRTKYLRSFDVEQQQLRRNSTQCIWCRCAQVWPIIVRFRPDTTRRQKDLTLDPQNNIDEAAELSQYSIKNCAELDSSIDR